MLLDLFKGLKISLKFFAENQKEQFFALWGNSKIMEATAGCAWPDSLLRLKGLKNADFLIHNFLYPWGMNPPRIHDLWMKNNIETKLIKVSLSVR